MTVYVLDACALLAVLAMEKGADNIRNFFQKSLDRQIILMMHKLNFLEVYYKVYKAYGKADANNLADIMTKMPLIIKDILTDETFKEAGRLKAEYRLSIADSVAVAETIVNEGFLVTSDHHEIEPVERNEKLPVVWFR